MKSAHNLQGPDLDALERSLKEVNLSLWNIEDMIRRHELQNDFGDEFINLARRVYKENDRRAALKAPDQPTLRFATDRRKIL